jgi:predicted  nucleic acid-binding Zn-ribbon protein
VYGTCELVKVFKKTYVDFKSEARAKVDEKETLAKEVRSYRMMVETYKNALSVAQGKVSVLMKEKEAMDEEVQRLKEENEEMKRKGSDGGGATVMKTVGEAVKRLVLEIGSWNGKVKEYLDIIFKLVGVSESEVNEVYWMKENKKKMMTTFNK